MSPDKWRIEKRQGVWWVKSPSNVVVAFSQTHAAAIRVVDMCIDLDRQMLAALDQRVPS